MPLAISVQVTARAATVVVRGDLDLTTLPDLTARLRPVLNGRPEGLVFDMTGVGFMDCAAARLIAGTAGSLPPGRLPVLRSPGRLVRRLLDLTELAGHVQVEGGEEPDEH